MTEAKSKVRHTPSRERSARIALSRENKRLREQLAKLAALVDHYYAAYREAQSLLERRERELAELRRRLDSKPAALHRGHPGTP
jgi:hypothetical protein